MRWAYRRLKINREENLTKYVWFVHAYVEKAKSGKINDEKGSDKQNTARLISTMKNKTHFSL